MGDDGEVVVVSRGGVPVAKLVRLGDESLPRRRLGIIEGKVQMSDDFDDPLSDVVLSAAKATGFVGLSIDVRAGLVLRRSPAVHDDPFGRLWASQPIDAGVVFLTSDAALAACSSLVRRV